MTEKQMQVIFKKYLENNPPNKTEIYELKISKTNSLPFNAIQTHQEEALLKASNTNFYHKLSDPPVFYGMNTKFNLKRPFDCFNLYNINAYIVLWFYKPKQKKVFYKLPIKEFIKLRDNATRKSMTEQMLQYVAEKLFI